MHGATPAPSGSHQNRRGVLRFPDICGRRVTAIIRSRAQPSVLEVANRGALAEIDRAQGTDRAARGAALLVVQTAGYGADEEMEVIAAALSTTPGRITYPGDSDADHHSWLRHHGMEPEADRWTISQDVAVPRSALSSMLTAAEHVGQRHGVDGAAVAHTGDGILHLSWSVPQHPLDGNTRPPSLLAAVDEVYAGTSKLGGATSNVRGAGLLTQEIDKAVTALRRDLRAVVDPHGVLGPDARVENRRTEGATGTRFHGDVNLVQVGTQHDRKDPDVLAGHPRVPGMSAGSLSAQRRPRSAATRCSAATSTSLSWQVL